MKINVDESILKILKFINNSGYEAYLVGGYVRDKLLNCNSNDYDICTNIPFEILEKNINILTLESSSFEEETEIIDKEIIPIHHCLFKKKEVKTEDIEIIASHIQALNQTKENRKKYFPNYQEKEMKDTALAARLLSEGKLSNKHAVLCRKEAGEMYKLELIKENLEDNKDNYTEFHIYKIAE